MYIFKKKSVFFMYVLGDNVLVTSLVLWVSRGGGNSLPSGDPSARLSLFHKKQKFVYQQSGYHSIDSAQFEIKDEIRMISF